MVKFWCTEANPTDGQFGGGWGDDVEAWRHWTPILLGFKHPELEDCWTRYQQTESYLFTNILGLGPDRSMEV